MILTLDLGTTSNRCLAIDAKGNCLAQSQQEFPQHFPKPGWVEHNANDIWTSTLTVMQNVLDQLQTPPTAIAITNQRETTVAWDKTTGEPLHNAIVWQCRRTADRMTQLSDTEKALIKSKTGLPADAYFSASKIQWLLENSDAVKHAAKNNNLCFGTIDSWILFKLSDTNTHSTDTSNASRTMLVNIHTQDYDPDLLTLFNIKKNTLPHIHPSDTHFANSNPSLTKTPIPILAILGDQQAALFAQCGSDPTKVKNTYGTGLFVCACTGKTPIESDTLLSTIAWTRNKTTYYAVEGSIFVGGSAIQWCRDQLGIINNAQESDTLAQSIPDNDNVYFVPALTGLGAPHWDASARGLLIGLTRGTSKAHIIRAVLESLAYQTNDVIDIIKDLIPTLKTLQVDGGASTNSFLMQFQSDILNLPVIKPSITETTAYGVAGLAGIQSNLFDEPTFRQFFQTESEYKPTFKKEQIDTYITQWKNALQRSRHWS